MHENISLKSGVRSIVVINFDVHLFYKILDTWFLYVVDRADNGKQNISFEVIFFNKV